MRMECRCLTLLMTAKTAFVFNPSHCRYLCMQMHLYGISYTDLKNEYTI